MTEPTKVDRRSVLGAAAAPEALAQTASEIRAYWDAHPPAAGARG